MSTCIWPHDLWLVKRGPNAFRLCIRCDLCEYAGPWTRTSGKPYPADGAT